MRVTVSVQAAVHPGRRAGRSAQRQDIQGLRAVAVGLVLAFHAGVPFIRGGYVGVDVFFVISGFLITGLIVRQIGATGHLSLARFYARRARRLLPATAATFVGVAVLTVVVLPATRWASVAGDMVASALYVVNWRLAARSVDYLAQGSAASPLQHFWSLAVEEQFYIVWPLLIVVLAWWARRRGRSGDGVRLSAVRLAAGLLVIVLPSLVWSVYLTVADPGPAYFVTTTRLWELGIGALLAVGATQAARVPVAARAVAGWVGLGTIGVAAVVFTEATPFPGTAALVPTLGTAAVLWAGLGDGRGRVRALDWSPMQDVGALSYSLYLWHWPVLVAATALWGDAEGHLWLPTALMAAAASVVPAWLSYRMVEGPLHHHPALAVPWRAAIAGAVCVAIGLGSAAVISWSFGRQRQSAEAAAAAAAPPADLFGAAALGDDPATSPAGVPVDYVDSITPDPIDAADDVPTLEGHRCMVSAQASESVVCDFGDPAASTVVAVVGDSKMDQWLPALEEIAGRRGWRFTTRLVSACPFVSGTISREGIRDEDCQAKNDERLDAVVNDPSIDVVLVSQNADEVWVEPGSGVDPEKAMEEDLLTTWARLRDSGKAVVVLANNAGPPFQEIECVAEHATSLTSCAFPAVREGSSATLLRGAAAADVPVVDMRKWICPGAECPAVIGGVLVYRQGSHITATYARTVADVLERMLIAVGLP